MFYRIHRRTGLVKNFPENLDQPEMHRFSPIYQFSD